MTNKPVPTALETKTCPPHLFHIEDKDIRPDGWGLGKCTKPGCTATEWFVCRVVENNSTEYKRRLSIGGKKGRAAATKAIRGRKMRV